MWVGLLVVALAMPGFQAPPDDSPVEDSVVFLQDITRDMYLRLHPHNNQAELRPSIDRPPNIRSVFEPPQTLIQATASVTKDAMGTGVRPVAPDTRPGAPAVPAAPAVPIFVEKITGYHVPLMAKGLESAFDREAKRVMEGQYVHFYFDPNGAQDGSGIGYDDPLGQEPTETNLCFALLENWLRSCSEPQLLLELESEEYPIPNGTDPRAPTDFQFNLAEIPPEAVANSTRDLQEMSKQEQYVQIKNHLLQEKTFVSSVLGRKDYLQMLTDVSEHPVMAWYYLSQPVGISLLKDIHSFIQRAPPPSQHGTRPQMEIFSIFSGLVMFVSGLMAALLAVAGAVGKAGAALDGFSTSSPITDDIWNTFRADKGPPGIRAGFAQPEMYDARGPYGPEPFPFQTPGAEKCHRFLTSYVWKCAAT